MTDHAGNMQSLWQGEAQDAPRLSLDFVRHQQENLRRRTQMRNAFEYASGLACMALITWSGWDILAARPLMQAATILWVVGGLSLLYRWHRRAKSRPPAADAGMLDALSFLRRELVRQRDARRGLWQVSWLTLAPGLAVLYVALFTEFVPAPWTAIGLMSAWLVLGAWAGARFHQKDADRIQREIDALDSLAVGK